MRGNTGSLTKKIKVVALSTAAVGMLYGSACTLGDLRLNVVNGTLSFVKGYTTDLWEALFPAPDAIIGN